MYFNENKGDTNIDKEFNSSKKVDVSKYKKYLIYAGIALLAIILIIIIAVVIKKAGSKTQYSLTLEGQEEITIYQGTNYIEPGYIAKDNKGNDLTSSVDVKDNLDTSTIGTYTIVYTMKDKTLKRTINVVEGPATPTTIHLSGDKNIYLKVGDTYSEPGYYAVDTIDGNLTSSVVISGAVDTSKAGIYRIVYSVVNSNGVTTSEARTIIVE